MSVRAAGRVRWGAGLAFAAIVLGGCNILAPQVRPVPGDDPAMDIAPIGPTIELGSGEALGIRWRYLIWESRMGTCTSLELAAGGGGTSCGGEVGRIPPGAAATLSGIGSGTGMPTTIEGFATGEVAAIVIETRQGDRVPATLMSLAPAGADGQAFVALVPSDRSPVRMVALGGRGDEIGSEEIQLR